MNNTTENNIRDFLKGLSDQDFLRIGINEIAYMRPVGEIAGDKSIGIYAADGTQLGVLESKDRALEAMRHNDLVPVTVH